MVQGAGGAASLHNGTGWATYLIVTTGRHIEHVSGQELQPFAPLVERGVFRRLFRRRHKHARVELHHDFPATNTPHREPWLYRRDFTRRCVCRRKHALFQLIPCVLNRCIVCGLEQRAVVQPIHSPLHELRHRRLCHSQGTQPRQHKTHNHAHTWSSRTPISAGELPASSAVVVRFMNCDTALFSCPASGVAMKAWNNSGLAPPCVEACATTPTHMSRAAHIATHPAPRQRHAPCCGCAPPWLRSHHPTPRRGRWVPWRTTQGTCRPASQTAPLRQMPGEATSCPGRWRHVGWRRCQPCGGSSPTTSPTSGRAPATGVCWQPRRQRRAWERTTPPRTVLPAAPGHRHLRRRHHRHHHGEAARRRLFSPPRRPCRPPSRRAGTSGRTRGGGRAGGCRL